MKGILLNLTPLVYNNSLLTIGISEKNKTRRNNNIAHKILTVKHFPPEINLKKNNSHNSSTTIKKERYKKLPTKIINLTSINHQEQQTKAANNVALKEQLIEHYGLYAKQYLYSPSTVFSDCENIALGLYTNGEYRALNKSLRGNYELSKGDAMIHRGLTSSFNTHSRTDNVLKTYRGSKGNDVFSQVAQGRSVRDAGYLSTSRDLKTAKVFCGKNKGNLSIIFGHSGIDVSHISIEGDNESEVLYKNNIEMTVLFSGKDPQGVTQRVLHEATLPAEAGTQKNLINALDIPVSSKKTS